MLVLAGLLVAGTTFVGAQAPPQTQPLVQAGNLVYLGRFTLPTNDGGGGNMMYGGAALGLGPDGQSLYFGCQDGTGRLARVTIPPIGGVGAMVEPCRAVPNLQGIKPSDTNGIKLGGSLSWNGRLITSAYVFYDGSGSAASSHFAGPGGVSTLTGPFRVGTEPPGMIGGYMGVVPQEWRSLLGGPALTGKCCTSIIWRSSYGPSASVFDPNQVGAHATTPSTMLVGYPEGHQTLGAWDGVNTYYTGTMRVGGLAFPAGTRSLLFVSRRGETFCYGSGAECSDPTNADKGTHGYPYRHVVTAYDAVDLLAVKQGAKRPWQVLPYAQWTLPEMANDGTADMSSAAYDPATRRWYITAGLGHGAPVVHVYEITNAILQPPVSRPRNLAATVGADGLTLTWAPPEGSPWLRYRLEVGTAPGASDAGVQDVASTLTSLTLPATATGTFYFRLRALYADGSDGLSNEVQVTFGPTAGATLTNFRATAGASEITLTWDPVTDSSVSNVVVDVGSAPGLSDLVHGALVGRGGRFVATNVPAGRYYLRARAVAATGQGAPTHDVEVVVGAAPVPSSPFDFAIAVGPGRSIAITWAYDTGRAVPTRFVMEGGTRSGLADLGAVALPVGNRFDAGPVPPGEYFLRLRAGTADGLSAPSNEVRIVVP